MGERMKSALVESQLSDRLGYDLDVLEIHMLEKDLVDRGRFISWVKEIQQRGVRVYLHQPFTHGGGVMNNLVDEREEVRLGALFQLREVVSLARELGVKVVVHWDYFNKRPLGSAERDRVKTIMGVIGPETRDVVKWENSLYGDGSFESEWLIEEIIRPLKLRLCVDLSHAFLSYKGDNDKLAEVVERLADQTDYYHVVDSKGEVHDGLELGEGRIDFSRVVDYVDQKDYIFEIDIKDYDDALPMKNSREYFDELKGV